jgi:hypothetical protein
LQGTGLEVPIHLAMARLVLNILNTLWGVIIDPVRHLLTGAHLEGP